MGQIPLLLTYSSWLLQKVPWAEIKEMLHAHNELYSEPMFTQARRCVSFLNNFWLKTFIALVLNCGQQANTQHFEGMESHVSFITLYSCISHFKITFLCLFFMDVHVDQRKYNRSHFTVEQGWLVCSGMPSEGHFAFGILILILGPSVKN